MRGSHPGSFEDAHALRDGTAFDNVTDTGETYDLIVVGGGISGLSAAHFYRQAKGPTARILVLDNHDSFGGHAKRNEFTVRSTERRVGKECVSTCRSRSSTCNEKKKKKNKNN